MSAQDRKSFRKKYLEESKPERDAAKSASTTNEILDSINTGISNVQVSSELMNDVLENKSNELIETFNSFNKTLQDGQAASELILDEQAKANDILSDLDTVSKAIENKISQLSAALETKFGPGAEALNLPNPVSDSLPDSDFEPPVIPELPFLPPIPFSDPNESVIPTQENPLPVVQEDPGERKDNGKDDESKRTKILDDILKTSKTGFKGLIGLTDKITGMLFKYTVTAAVQAAKTAAMILALIVGIDIISANFSYWSDKLGKDFGEFRAMAGNWGQLFQGIIDTVDEIKDAWNSDDPLGIVMAIGKGMGNLTKNMAELIGLAITTGLAELLRALGFDEKADKLEGSYLDGYQERTGNTMSDRQQTVLAKYQVKQMEEQDETNAKVYDRYKNRKEGAKTAYQYGGITEQDYNSIMNQSGPEKSVIAGMTDDQKIEFVKARNNAEASMSRTSERLEKIKPGDDRKLKALENEISNIRSILDSDAIKSAPAEQARLNKQYTDLINLKASKSEKPKPEAVSETQDAVQLKQTQAAVQANTANTTAAGSAAKALIQQNNNVQNKTMYNIPPTTSISSPGMQRSLNTN